MNGPSVANAVELPSAPAEVDAPSAAAPSPREAPSPVDAPVAAAGAAAVNGAATESESESSSSSAAISPSIDEALKVVDGASVVFSGLSVRPFSDSLEESLTGQYPHELRFSPFVCNFSAILIKKM